MKYSQLNWNHFTYSTFISIRVTGSKAQLDVQFKFSLHQVVCCIMSSPNKAIDKDVKQYKIHENLDEQTIH